jgi:hypothetical protein
MNGNNPSLVRAIRGPVVLITLGALFALNNFTELRFQQTWPVLLIVFGLLSLLRRGTETVGPPAPPPYYPPPPTAGPGTFRQSNYPGEAPPSAPPEPPAKGGFGSSAQSRNSETGPAPGEIA